MVKDVFLAGAARTAIGGFGGAFAEVAAPALGSAAIKAALARSGVSADQGDEARNRASDRTLHKPLDVPMLLNVLREVPWVFHA